MKRAELVFIPSPGAGHLVSTLEFARRLLLRDSTFSITILVMKLSFAPLPASDSKQTSSASPTSTIDENSIRHIVLPDVQMPPSTHFKESPEKFITDFVAAHKPHVRDVIKTTAPTAALVVDMFCTSMIDIANELDLPSYLFFTSSAGFLGLSLYFPVYHDRVGREFNESDPDSIVPSFKNPVPASVLPSFALQKAGFYAFLDVAKRFKDTKGIIVNTFAELEPYALDSFNDGQTPPVYTVGPVLDLLGRAHGRIEQEHHDRIIGWLDGQPESSVVLLCFGSVGYMREPQAREVALGVLRSGTRFLWSLRKPPPRGEFGRPVDYSAEDLKEILTEEFVSALKDGRGMVCGWVPQAEVLAHSAIGGFVSHCGWNSILESLWFGKPIATWPMYAEQQGNAFELVRELGLSVELRLDYRRDGEDVVLADEIERAIGCLMEQGSCVRKRVEEMSEVGRKALTEGGSSYVSLGRLIEDMKNRV